MQAYVFAHTLAERRRALLGYAAAAVAVVAMYVGVFPSFQDQMAGYADAMPDGMAAFMGNDFASPAGYLHSTIFTILGPLLIVASGVSWAAATVAGEEDHRTLPLLLSAPVTRLQLALQKWGAVLVGTTLIAAVVFTAVAVMVRTTGLDLPTSDIAAAAVHLHGLGVLAAGVAFGVGAATGRRTAALAAGAGLVVAGFVLSGLSGMVEALEPARWLSPFYWFNGHEPIRNGVHWPSLGLLYGVGLLAAAVGIARFTRRDLR